MPRFYVRKNDKWNIFSSIVDDFLYDSFMPFDELEAVIIGELVVDKMKELGTLLTDRPVLNTMTYDEAMDRRRDAEDDEEDEEDEEDEAPCRGCFGASFNDCDTCRKNTAEPDCPWK